MRKTIVATLVGLALTAFAVNTTEALDLGATGVKRAKLEDASNIYSTPAVGGPMVAEDLGDVVNVGDEQRSIFHITTVFDSDDSTVVYDTSSATELTGLLYDLKVLKVTYTSPLTLIIDFGAAGRNPFTGLPGTDVDGDLATLPAGFVTGGVLEIYEDPAKDFTRDPAPTVSSYASKITGTPGEVPIARDANSGPASWTEGAAGHVPGAAGADTFAGSSDGSYLLAATLLDLNYLVSIGEFLPPATPYAAGAVLREVIDLSDGTGTSVGRLNIVGGSAASSLARSVFAPLVDMTLRANLQTAIIVDPDLSLLAAVPFLSGDEFANDAAGDYVGTGQWQIESEDPVRLQWQVIPEPATMSLLGLSLLGLVGVRFGKKS